MWILDLLPFWIFHLILGAGIAGAMLAFLFGNIPFVSNYVLPLKIISIFVIICGLYMEGGISNQERWEAKVKEVQTKVAAAEVESVKENVKIIEKTKTRVEVVKMRGDDIVKYVDREVVKYDDQCKIPKEFIKAHNDAAEPVK